VERVVLNALSKTDAAAPPPDICAFGGRACHRLQEKPIHLWRVERVAKTSAALPPKFWCARDFGKRESCAFGD